MHSHNDTHSIHSRLTTNAKVTQLSQLMGFESYSGEYISILAKYRSKSRICTSVCHLDIRDVRVMSYEFKYHGEDDCYYAVIELKAHTVVDKISIIIQV